MQIYALFPHLVLLGDEYYRLPHERVIKRLALSLPHLQVVLLIPAHVQLPLLADQRHSLLLAQLEHLIVLILQYSQRYFLVLILVQTSFSPSKLGVNLLKCGHFNKGFYEC